MTLELDWTASWRQMQRKNDPVGHREPATLSGMVRGGLFDMASPVSWTVEEAEAQSPAWWPGEITLQVYVLPLTVGAESLKIWYALIDEGCLEREPCLFYDTATLYRFDEPSKLIGPQAWNQEISVVYACNGTYVQEGARFAFQGKKPEQGEWVLNLPPGDVLLKYTFDCMTESVTERRGEENGLACDWPGKPRHGVYYPWGGRYNPDGDLGDCVQVFGRGEELDAHGEKRSTLVLHTLTALKRRGADPPLEGRPPGEKEWGWIFPFSSHTFPLKSIGAGITQGDLKISCGLGPDDPTPRIYRSVRHTMVDRGARLAEIVFLPLRAVAPSL